MHNPEATLGATCFVAVFYDGAGHLRFRAGHFSSARAEEIKIGVVDTEKESWLSPPNLKALKKIENSFYRATRSSEKWRQVQDTSGKLLKNKQKPCGSGRRNKAAIWPMLNLPNTRGRSQPAPESDEVAALQLTATKAIQVIAEAEKYDLVLPLRDIVYRSQRVDITEKVCSRRWLTNSFFPAAC